MSMHTPWQRIRKYMPTYLTIGAAFLLYGLSMLPRWVVDNESERVSSGTAIPFVHELQMDVGLRMQILRWKSLWQQSGEWKWADSLAYTYLQYSRIDSALRYSREMMAIEVPEALRRSALHTYRAYDLSTDSSRWQSLAQEARQSLTAASHLYPKDYALRVKVALTYLRSRRPMQGIQLLSQLQKEAPEAPDVLFHLARLSLQTGQYKKGEEKLRKLLQLYPSHVEGMLYLGRYLMQNKKVSEGQSLLKQARSITSDPALLQIINEQLLNNQ